MIYTGRFAPSPTGPLHFGSIVTATASYLDARAAAGCWLLRIEDVDTSRIVPGAADGILRTLEAFGFEWTGPVVYQTERTGLYQNALDKLVAGGAAFGCACSRVPGRYPGTCRTGAANPRAWRVLTKGSGEVCFTDRAHGHCCQNVEEEVGDFIVQRAEGVFAYQLAVVVDDALQGVTDVVRGADLLDSTPRQIWLQRLLGYPLPRYLHAPVAVNKEGQKLSKQTLANPVEPAGWRTLLPEVLTFLGQPVPDAGNLTDFWTEAASRWNSGALCSAGTRSTVR